MKKMVHRWQKYPKCPACGALPGNPCHGMHGVRGRPHIERQQKGSYMPNPGIATRAKLKQ